MSNLGPEWEDDEDYSPARMNAKGILRDTGTNIVAIAATKQLGLVCPTDTSGGLVKNVVYYTNYDSSFNRISFEPIFHRHTHDVTADSEEDGGSYLDIRLSNISEFAEISWTAIQFDPNSFWDISFLNGTLTYAAPSTDNAFHMIDTLSTTGNYITAIMTGIRFEWGQPLMIDFATALSDNSNILARTGMGIDSVDQSPSTSRRQLALEGCDGHGTNWVMLNANGNTASLVVTATTMPLAPGSEKHYRLEHLPADSAKVYYEDVLNATSTTNVADDGNSEERRPFRWGVKLPTGTNSIQQNLYWIKIIGNQKVNT